MKKSMLTCLMLILLIGSVSAFVSPFHQINLGEKVLFSEESGIQIKNNRMWISFIEMGIPHLLKLGVSDNYGLSFTYTVIDTISVLPALSAPSLEVNEDSIVNIFYTRKHNETSNINLHHVKVENGQIVSSQVILDGVKNEPIIKRFGNTWQILAKKYLYKQLAYFQYFTNKELNILAEEGVTAYVSFNGNSIFNGPVHSNSDIRIFNGPGQVNPNSPGWPLFENFVSTSKQFVNQNQNSPLIGSPAPVDGIFQGGYQENADSLKIDWIGSAPLISPYGSSTQTFENKIFKCHIEGSMINVYILDFTQTHIDTFVVYKHYPDEEHPVVTSQPDTYMADSLWTNYITIRDTLWHPPYEFSIENNGIYLPGTVWIEGNVSGKTMVACGGDAYITGNITYAETTPGQSPDNNTTDFFGLVSEKSIYLKYKYREPYDGSYITHANNSQGPDGHVYLYGAYAALGRNTGGENGFRNEGVFSYEYQHPHGAVMPFRGISQFTGQDTLYKYIDFHRHRFPPVSPNISNRPLWHYWPNQTPDLMSNGYPNNSISDYDYTQAYGDIMYKTSDYPWYNPVWPEKDAGPVPQNLNTDITWERGTLHLFGSIAQQRRGFMHRSGTASSNNNLDMGIWNPPYVLGPPHRPTGYQLDYHYDSRLADNQLPYFPSTLTGISEYRFLQVDENSQVTDNQLIEDLRDVHKMMFTSDSNRIACIYKRGQNTGLYLKYSNNQGQNFETIELPLQNPIADMMISDNWLNVLYLQSNQWKMLRFNLDNEAQNTIHLNIEDTEPEAYLKPQLLKTTNNNLLLAIYEGNEAKNDNLNELENPVLLDSFETLDFDQFCLFSGPTDSLYIIAKKDTATESLEPWMNYDHFDKTNRWSDIYLAKACLNGITPVEEETIQPEKSFSLLVYPNPFNPATTVDFFLPEQDEINLYIYNIKGQKINTLHKGILGKGQHHFIFNGKDTYRKSVASGIYFIRLEGQKYNYTQKVLLLK